MTVNKKMVNVGVIVGAHGIRGAVRVKSFTSNPTDLVKYGALYSRDQVRMFNAKVLFDKGSVVIVKFKDVDTRNQAEALVKTELFVEKDKLPEVADGEYYYTDLINLNILTTKNEPYGRIIAVHNFGAGDIVEIQLEGSTAKTMHIFNNATFPTIDLTSKNAVIAIK